MADPLKRLESLLAQVRSKKALSYDEVEELSQRYQWAAAELARLRAVPGQNRRRQLMEALTKEAHFVVYQAPSTPMLQRLQRVVRSMAQALFVTRRLQWLTFVTFALGLLVGFFATAAEPERAHAFMSLMFPAELVQDLLHSPTVRQEYIESGRGAGTGFKAVFAASLALNNTRVALTAFALGIFFAVPTIIVQVINGALVGSMAALYHQGGTAVDFWAWVLPHGVPEMWALILAGAGGLHLGLTLIDPKNRPRREALTRAAGHALGLLGLAALMLLYAAVIEGFFRQSSLPAWPRYSLAVFNLVALSWLLHRLSRVGAPSTAR